MSANRWDRLTGWSSSAAHQEVKKQANRRWRHHSKAWLRQGDRERLDYVSVAWVW